MKALPEKINQQVIDTLARTEPQVEVLLCELSGSIVRLYIDHPDGVSLGLCERVTRDLGDLLIEYSLEVSSPGPERPLSKPEHFRRFVGRKARLRTRAEHQGRRTFVGELVDAGDNGVTVAADGSLVSLEYSDLDRSNLVAEKVLPPARPKQKRAKGHAQKKLNS